MAKISRFPFPAFDSAMGFARAFSEKKRQKFELMTEVTSVSLIFDFNYKIAESSRV